MKINKTKIYYALLTTIVGLNIVMTIFQGGLSTHHSTKIAQLKLQKNNLLQQQLKLSAELSQKSSLSQIINQEDLGQFQVIGKTIIITSNQEVASR